MTVRKIPIANVVWAREVKEKEYEPRLRGQGYPPLVFLPSLPAQIVNRFWDAKDEVLGGLSANRVRREKAVVHSGS